MAFTNTPNTDIYKVRLEIGDFNENEGVFPDGKNFSDEQITYFLTKEGHVQRAIAGMLETLSVVWATAPDIANGPRKETYKATSELFAKRAAALRIRYGYADDKDTSSPTDGMFVIPTIRQDGYSTEIFDYTFPTETDL